MDLRLGLYLSADEHRLDAAATTQLERSAGLADTPPGLARRVALGLAVLAAALVGLGLVFWVAAHWDTLGRWGRFALLQGTLGVMAAGAFLRPAARLPLSLLVLLTGGAVLAYFGQTYQTGADAWQLFALWAALMLPLAGGQRSDVLWVPWALVAMTAVALWVQTHTGHGWRAEPQDLPAHAAGAVLALGVVALLGPLGQPRTGAGVWALRTALTLAVVMLSASALGGLFQARVAGQYTLGLLVLAALAAVLAVGPARWFDIFGLSAVALGLNTLLCAGLARALFDGGGGGGEPLGRLLLLGAVAAALLAATVSILLRLHRAHEVRRTKPGVAS
ncbi:MAG: DUF2157 domain-containing protein [Rubrivivax sp.]|nr:DUF2157 domain-containing protein [Rubrivivax sp.]